jgi:hypothetical protein
MRRRLLYLITALGIATLGIVVVVGLYVQSDRRTHTDPTMLAAEAVPTIAYYPNAILTPQIIATLPSAPPSSLFENPSAPAIQADGTLAPDASRVLTLADLQVSLVQYQAKQGAYPEHLAELFPTFAPLGIDGKPLNAPPTDPVTHHPYSYEVTNDGNGYRLSAMLDSGKRYTVTSP